jgi:putative membrane protein
MDLRLLYLTIHLIGFATWTGSILWLTSLLKARGGESDSSFVAKLGALAKEAGRAADIGATLTLAGGLAMLSTNVSGYMQQPWMHAKLTLVLVLLGVHGFLRAKTRRGGSIPKAIGPIAGLVAATIVALVIFKPGAH